MITITWGWNGLPNMHGLGSFQKAVYFCNLGIMLCPITVRKAT